ncbi:MAG TPA: tetratricopeptide repeat protein, partial [Polyangiaceae bacterium]|nr:tetratricopeptide repeat protein [Polyangiaceae bacterium]
MSPVPQQVERDGFAAATSSDALWKALTQQGNAARANGDATAARALYEEALAEAERVFETARLALMPDAAALAPVLYNISCANLAQQRQECGDADAAIAWLERAFDRLLHTTEGAVSCAPSATPSACATPAPRTLRLACA